MKVLLLNEYHNIVSQNLIHYLAEILGPDNFNWTGRRYYRTDFYPLSDLEKQSLKPEPESLTRLQNGEYDFVIFSEGTTYIYISSHLPLSGTKRVVLDCSDSVNIPRFYWENSEIYFKAQLNKQKTVIKNKKDNNAQQIDGNKLYPFSLTPSFKVYGFKNIMSDKNNFDIYFAGSAWPQKRVQLISALKSYGNINFFGGLYNRDDLEFNCVIPDAIRFKKISQDDHIHSMNTSKICLNIEGNGKNCFRQFEAMFLGRCLLTQKHDNCWGHIDPIDNNHCMLFDDNNIDLINKVNLLLNSDNLIKEISEKGQEFYNSNYHPKELSKHLVNILSNYLKD